MGDSHLGGRVFGIFQGMRPVLQVPAPVADIRIDSAKPGIPGGDILSGVSGERGESRIDQTDPVVGLNEHKPHGQPVYEGAQKFQMDLYDKEGRNNNK